MKPEQIQQWAREAGFPFNKFGLLEGEHDIDVYLYDFAILARADAERMTEQVIAGADLARADLEADNEKLNDDVTMHMRVAVKAIDECVELKAENETLRYEVDAIAGIKQERDALKAEVESLRQQVRKEQMYVQELAAELNQFHFYAPTNVKREVLGALAAAPAVEDGV